MVYIMYMNMNVSYYFCDVNVGEINLLVFRWIFIVIE